MDYPLICNETITHKITPNYQFFIPIIQGSWKTKTIQVMALNYKQFQYPK
jgi:hypothetical protein